MYFGLLNIIILTFSVARAFFFDSLFGTAAPTKTTSATTKPPYSQGSQGMVLDYFAHKLCPKHLQRNKYLMYYSYVKRCYTFVITDRADWFTAKEDCAQNGGNLMNIHQTLENFYLGMRDQVALGHDDAYIWIGLSDTVTPGNFSWINGPLKTYKHWHSGQPNLGSPGNNCGAYSHNTQDWWTFPCNSTKLGWVCEFELNATIPDFTSKLVPTSTTNLVSKTPLTSPPESTPEPTPELHTSPKPTPETTTPEPIPETTTTEPIPEITTPEPIPETTTEPIPETTPEPTPVTTTPEPTPEPTLPEPTPEPTRNHYTASKQVNTPKHTTPIPMEAKETTTTIATTSEEVEGIIIIGK